MGMSASQARLLSITARIHDIEFEAQSIQNAKIQLATQSDRAYNDYIAALDATTLTLTTIDPKSGAKANITANFNNLCSINRATVSNGEEYALIDSRNRLIVSPDIYKAYKEFQDSGLAYGDTPQMFALYMMGSNLQYKQLLGIEEEAFQKIVNEENSETIDALHKKLVNMTGGGSYIYSANQLRLDDPEKYKEYEETFNAYQKLLYEKAGDDIYEAAGIGDSEDFDREEFNYYVSIYKQIQQCGGCISIDEFDGPNGDAANNSDWLHDMVQAGQITILTVKADKKTGVINMDGTSPSSDISLKYEETTSFDKTAMAKAEAKYEKSLKDINQKDKRFDLSLSKLEAERSALTTEYDSVKNVIKENIDRTFKIFS